MIVGYYEQRSLGTRKGETSLPAMRQTDLGQTRVSSPRQLPTDHDHAGGHKCSIREYQSEQPSSKATSTFARNPSHREERRRKRKIGLDGSLHISRKVLLPLL